MAKGPRSIHKLSPLKVAKAGPGKYGDGGGLWLFKDHKDAGRWVYRYRFRGESHELGLGSIWTINADEAREEARLCRKLQKEGKDPLAERRAKEAQARLEVAKAMTFEQCAQAYIEAHGSKWHNPKHAAQWEATLAAYVFPLIGGLPVAAIDTDLILRVFEQEVDGASFWRSRAETAARVRARIENILDWATVRGYRAGANPAKWRGHLDNLLPARAKVQKAKHHAAMPYAELPGFMAKLRAEEGTSPRTLEFVVLTAARTGEALGATWGEIDFRDKIWVVPESRMKAGKEHRVPLSGRALAILEEMRASAAQNGPDSYVFPGMRHGRPLADMALRRVLSRLVGCEATVHGFRSTFRDWAAERTDYPSEACELALAHKVANKVEAAYRRGDLFERRRSLMDAWAAYCGGEAAPDNVVELRRAAM